MCDADSVLALGVEAGLLPSALNPIPRSMCCPSVWFMQRSSKIEVRYQDLQGQQQEMQLSGFVARIFQHEYDHLQVGLKEASQPGGPSQRCSNTVMGQRALYLVCQLTLQGAYGLHDLCQHSLHSPVSLRNALCELVAWEGVMLQRCMSRCGTCMHGQPSPTFCGHCVASILNVPLLCKQLGGTTPWGEQLPISSSGEVQCHFFLGCFLTAVSRVASGCRVCCSTIA